jgi:flavin-dependent dehydrogenase
MIDAKVIIVGGGPAGSTCAWKLRQSNVPVILLDKKPFPRPKTCAGWITPEVLADLHVNRGEYPYQMLMFRRLNYHFYGCKIPVRTKQFSIRRVEFDDWLIQRSGVDVIEHHVKQIRKEGRHYIIDGIYRCEYLVGAGGTNCCVYRTFFRSVNPRKAASKIIAVEKEFPYDYNDGECHLWFFENKLPGYAWYVPKGDGYLNIGIGGKYLKMKQRGQNMFEHWNCLVEKLNGLGLVHRKHIQPKGCSYFLRGRRETVQIDHAYVIGDAASLATLDMGEGIGAAVRSGILAARAIMTGQIYSTKTIDRYSLKNILLQFIT